MKARFLSFFDAETLHEKALSDDCFFDNKVRFKDFAPLSFFCNAGGTCGLKKGFNEYRIRPKNDWCLYGLKRRQGRRQRRPDEEFF